MFLRGKLLERTFSLAALAAAVMANAASAATTDDVTTINTSNGVINDSSHASKAGASHLLSSLMAFVPRKIAKRIDSNFEIDVSDEDLQISIYKDDMSWSPAKYRRGRTQKSWHANTRKGKDSQLKNSRGSKMDEQPPIVFDDNKKKLLATNLGILYNEGSHSFAKRKNNGHNTRRVRRKDRAMSERIRSNPLESTKRAGTLKHVHPKTFVMVKSGDDNSDRHNRDSNDWPTKSESNDTKTKDRQVVADFGLYDKGQSHTTANKEDGITTAVARNNTTEEDNSKEPIQDNVVTVGVSPPPESKGGYDLPTENLSASLTRAGKVAINKSTEIHSSKFSNVVESEPKQDYPTSLYTDIKENGYSEVQYVDDNFASQLRLRNLLLPDAKNNPQLFQIHKINRHLYDSYDYYENSDGSASTDEKCPEEDKELLSILVVTDLYPYEISWVIEDAAGDTYIPSFLFTGEQAPFAAQIYLCKDVAFNFTINDETGDGITCGITPQGLDTGFQLRRGTVSEGAIIAQGCGSEFSAYTKEFVMSSYTQFPTTSPVEPFPIVCDKRVTVTITTDSNSPTENIWAFFAYPFETPLFVYQPQYSSSTHAYIPQFDFCPGDEIAMFMMDAGNNGICCSYGNGSIVGMVGDEVVFETDGSFGDSFTQFFTIPTETTCEEEDQGEVTVKITPDTWASETTWYISDPNGSQIASGEVYSSTDAGKTFITTVPLCKQATYTFTINDSYGDGISCTDGGGGFHVLYEDTTLFEFCGDFGSSYAADITLGALPDSSPTSSASIQPSGMPSDRLSLDPSKLPSMQPSGVLSDYPSMDPSKLPSMQPSSVPSDHLSMDPSKLPSIQPSIMPSDRLSLDPSKLPSMQPSGVLSDHPSMDPSKLPSMQPSGVLSDHLSMDPSKLPSIQPSGVLSDHPSMDPSKLPSMQPSGMPSDRLSLDPSKLPSMQPSGMPSDHPSMDPSELPSMQPSIVCDKRVTVTITTDSNSPTENIWAFFAYPFETPLFVYQPQYSSSTHAYIPQFDFCPGDEIAMFMMDAGNNGICCSYGNGSIVGMVGDEVVFETDGSFGDSFTQFFTIPTETTCEEEDQGEVTVKITPDTWASETTWYISDPNGSQIASGEVYSSTDAGKTFITTVPLCKQATYTFTINDSYGDGIYCTDGGGGFHVLYEDTTLFEFCGDFGSSYAADITLGALPDSSPTTSPTVSPSIGAKCENADLVDIVVNLATDNYPSETSIFIYNETGDVILSGTDFSKANSFYSTSISLCEGEAYSFTITDSYGDGICCTHGNGSFSVINGDYVILFGGDFGSEYTANIVLDSLPDVPSNSPSNILSEFPSTRPSGSLSPSVTPCGVAEQVEIIVNITPDKYFSDTSWFIGDESGNKIIVGDGYTDSSSANSTFSNAIPLCSGVTYYFTINDSWGDGIYCYNDGGFDVLYDGLSLFSGCDFGSTFTANFSLPITSEIISDDAVDTASTPPSISPSEHSENPVDEMELISSFFSITISFFVLDEFGESLLEQILFESASYIFSLATPGQRHLQTAPRILVNLDKDDCEVNTEINRTCYSAEVIFEILKSWNMDKVMDVGTVIAQSANDGIFAEEINQIAGDKDIFFSEFSEISSTVDISDSIAFRETSKPTDKPTRLPTRMPNSSTLPMPSTKPTPETRRPTSSPLPMPSPKPNQPTPMPSTKPTRKPSRRPTGKPTNDQASLSRSKKGKDSKKGSDGGKKSKKSKNGKTEKK